MNFTYLRPLSSVLLLALAASTTLLPTQAKACGGTFCDNGPQVMPVDQSGENILFWIDRSDEAQPYTEAHIQIQYQGDPERFAWLVPVMEVPEVHVGSQALFDNLLQATVPTFTLSTRFAGDCGQSDAVIGCGFSVNSDFGADGGGSGLGDDGFGDPEDGPEILDRGFAGAFEYVVLTGESVDVIVDWLDAAGYAQDPDAPPILDEYLQEGFVFVAFKLHSGAGVDEIHPLSLRYPGVEPCIPIRLTRIAATDDMAIRAFFLGESRAAPQNWPHVELNFTALDWLSGAASDYLDLVSQAIDEAGGRAWITEYAGTDSVVSSTGLYDAKWRAEDYLDIDPIAVVDTLRSQELIDCVPGSGVCEGSHPQVRPLLERYLPAPEGVDEREYWSCLECYAELVDAVAWSAQPGFAAEFEDRIASPGLHATQVLEDASTLTRMFTLISPHEMTEDPLFHENGSLGTVDSDHAATQVFTCDGGPTQIELDNGRVVAFDFSYPEFEGMPAAERIERVPMAGPPQVELDNGDEIDAMVEAENGDLLTGPNPWSCSLARVRPEALLTMLALFGIAWLQRAPRRERA